MAVDSCEPQVLNALRKEGWIISGNQRLYLDGRTVIIDVKAVRTLNGSRQEVLLAEVKCFPDRKRITTDLYSAFGQYIVYRGIQSVLEDHTPLYLAIPEKIYLHEFDTGINRTVVDNHVKLVIVDIEREEVVKWIE